MRCSRFALVLAGVLGCVSCAYAATFTIAPDRMAVVDGERVFVIGLYENPQDDAVLDEAAAAGFNLLQTTEDPAALDRLQARGVWGWINTGARIDFSADTENRQAQLAKMAADFAAHPALMVWEVPDEALWNCWYGAMCWRNDEEPKQLSALIDALPDKDLAKRLGEELRQIGALRSHGDYAEAERRADDLWVAAGKTPPKPGYGLANAPARAAAMCAGMTAGYAKLRELDPHHPVWMNHAPRNQIEQLAAFNNGADIVGCDIYPVPFKPAVGHSDLMDRTLSSVGAYTDRMQAAAPGKPVWMVLQAFGWGDIQPERSEEERKELRRPTLAESRFMAYDAIVHGARGLLYWGSAYIEKDSQLWKDLLALAAELSGLQQILSAPDAPLQISAEYAPTFGSVDRSIRVLAKATDGKPWIIVVNDWNSPLSYTLRGLDELNGTTYTDKASADTAAVDNGTLRLTLPGQSVHILRPQ